jgi:hypothetical protein
VPRLINVICDTALVYGFADQKKKIDSTIIKLVLKDKQGGISPIADDESALVEKNPAQERRIEYSDAPASREVPPVQAKKKSKQKKLSSIERLFK